MMRKKLLHFVLEGGLKGIYFIGNEYQNDKGEWIKLIFQVTGHKGVTQTIPENLQVKLKYLNPKREINADNEDYLGSLLECREATPEEVSQVQSRLEKRVSSQSQPRRIFSPEEVEEDYRRTHPYGFIVYRD